MKKAKLLLLVSIMSLSLVGCGEGDITLNKEQNDLIAEYVASEMLKFSYANKWEYTKVRTALNKYQFKNPQAMTPTVTNPTVPNQTTNVTVPSQTANSISGNSNQNVAGGSSSAQNAVNGYEALANALELNGATVSYKTYSLGERYPMEEFAICLPAADGCKVLAVEFTINNNSTSEISLNTASKGVTLRLSVGGKTITQSASMLNNDLIALKNKKISAGSSFTACACFQVPESVAANPTDMSISVYKGGTSLGVLNDIH